MRIIYGFGAITLGLAGSARSQDWPQRQVTIIVPFTAGGTTDLFGRLVAQAHARQIRPAVHRGEQGRCRRQYRRDGGGAGAPDGHTLFLGTVSVFAINPFVYSKLPHDTERDFRTVSLIARAAEHAGRQSARAGEDRRGAGRHLKSNPDKLSYGSSGAGTSTHLASELFKMKTGTAMTHVPYRTSGDIMNA